MKKQNLDRMGGRRVTALRDSKRSLELTNNTTTDTTSGATSVPNRGEGKEEGGTKKRQRRS